MLKVNIFEYTHRLNDKLIR